MNKIVIGEEIKYGTIDVKDDVLEVNIDESIELDISDLTYSNIIFNINCKNVFILNINSNIKKININCNDLCDVEVNNFNSNDNSYDIDVSLGKKSEIKLVTSTISNTNNDVCVNIVHNGEASKSLCINNGVVKSGSISYKITGDVKRGAVNSSVVQDSKIIADDVSRALIKPILLIDEGVDEASHAASVGSYSSDVLFYMESRGIEKSEAIKLLNKGLLINNFKYVDTISNLI